MESHDPNQVRTMKGKKEQAQEQALRPSSIHRSDPASRFARLGTCSYPDRKGRKNKAKVTAGTGISGVLTGCIGLRCLS